MESLFEQGQKFTEMWMDYATRMATAGMSLMSGASPMEVAKQMRSTTLQAMTQYTDQFMRSPMFLEMMKQSLNGSMDLRKQMDDAMVNLRHQTQGPAKRDLDDLLQSIRHSETRILDRIDELADRMRDLERRMETLKGSHSSNGNGSTPSKSRRKKAAASTDEEQLAALLERLLKQRQNRNVATIIED